MQYELTKDGDSVYLECLNGGIGSRGKRRVCSTSDSSVSIASRLLRREHIKCDLDEFYRTHRFESRWDAVTLGGFVGVLVSRPIIALYSRRAA